MERHLATVSPEGQFILSTAAQAALHLTPGAEWEVSIEDTQITLHPAAEALVDELYGVFAGGPSLEDDLIASRKQDKW